jgi:hypothetical protein
MNRALAAAGGALALAALAATVHAQAADTGRAEYEAHC